MVPPPLPPPLSTNLPENLPLHAPPTAHSSPISIQPHIVVPPLHPWPLPNDQTTPLAHWHTSSLHGAPLCITVQKNQHTPINITLRGFPALGSLLHHLFPPSVDHIPPGHLNESLHNANGGSMRGRRAKCAAPFCVCQVPFLLDLHLVVAVAAKKESSRHLLRDPCGTHA